MANPNAPMTVADLMAWLAKQDATLPVHITCNHEYAYPLTENECNLWVGLEDGDTGIYIGEAL
jgi:hypothetical protein